MFLIISFLVLYYFIVVSYYFFGKSFAIGAAEYARLNNKGTKESEDCWQNLLDEYNELVDAFQQRNYFEIFMETFDVILSLIKYSMVNFLPRSVYSHRLSWTLIFPFVIPAAMKLGMRYERYGCIRNHARVNKNHKCIVNELGNDVA